MLSSSVISFSSFANSVDLFINFCSMVISQLTSTGYSKHNSGRMPSSDTSNSSETSVSFLLQMFNTKSLHNSLNSLTLGDTYHINHFILSENGINFHFLFKKAVHMVNFLGYAASVYLNFKNVVLFLPKS